LLFEVKDVDRRFYQEHLAGFLPKKMLDIHTHIWLKAFRVEMPTESRGQSWPRRVAEDNSIEDLLETYRLLLPEQEVTPVLFGWPERNADMDQTNAYANLSARQHGLPSLMVTNPEWKAQDLEQRALSAGFLGLKPYLNWAPLHIPSQDIQIYDFLPPAHLEVADQYGWIVILHIPRPGRLKDPLNLQQMLEIEQCYPNIKLVIAHVGRAYCPQDIGDAFDVLQASQRMLFDFSANTSALVIEGALRAFGAQRVLFGSDLPIVRMRMRRICEDGAYINLVPPGLYGDVSGDPHMRQLSQPEGDQLSFFLYEMLLAFRRAAEACGLSATEVEDVLYKNGARLIENTRRYT
jgi:uncharacterized protein